MKRAMMMAAVMLLAGSAFAAEENKMDASKAPTLPPQEVLKFKKGEIYLGKADAPVEIVEYASMSCSHCAHFSDEVFPKVYDEYIKTGKVRWLMRHFVLNKPAVEGAKLVECAPKGKRYKFIKVLFKLQEKWAFTMDPDKALKTIANVGGLDDKAFDKCIADKALEDRILAQRLEAEKNLKIEGTPTFFINGEPVTGVGEYEPFKAILDPIVTKAEAGMKKK